MSEAREAPDRRGLAWALLPMLVAVVAALLGPWDLDEDDQARQALWALDVWNGRWVLPLERGVLPTTKPPLYAWLAALASIPFGGPTRLSCQLPSALAALGLAGVTWRLAAERWGRDAGLAAAWILGASPFVPVLVHVRPDALLALLVLLGLFALHRLERGAPRGMAWLFWGAVAGALLAKGPVALLLGPLPAAALALDPVRRAALRPLVRSPAPLLLLLPLVWLGLVAARGGEGWLAGTALGETVDRALGAGSMAGKGKPPGYLLVYFVLRFLPWSPLAVLGLARALGRAGDPRARPLAVWLLVTLGALSLPRVQRWVYLLPVFPAAACLAAAQLDGLRLRAQPARWPRPVFALATAGTLAALVVWHARWSSEAVSGRGAGTAAFVRGLEGELRPGDRLLLYEGKLGNALHFLLGRNEPALGRAELAALLARPAPGATRTLLVTSGDGSLAQLHADHPGRFALRREEGRGERLPTLVLLEWVAPPR